MSRSNPRVLSTLERAGGFASAQEVYRLMQREGCLLYTSDAADDLLCVDLGGQHALRQGQG